jgi:uncharacterized protein
LAQVPPSENEIQRYTGLHRAAARGEVASIKPGNVDVRDARGRTPLHVAAFRAQHEAMRALVAAGADPNALENDRYDVVTIAAVANDVPTLKVALQLGTSAKNITSRYDGTALIAAAHLGNAEVEGSARCGCGSQHPRSRGRHAARPGPRAGLHGNGQAPGGAKSALGIQPGEHPHVLHHAAA